MQDSTLSSSFYRNLGTIAHKEENILMHRIHHLRSDPDFQRTTGLGTEQTQSKSQKNLKKKKGSRSLPQKQTQQGISPSPNRIR